MRIQRADLEHELREAVSTVSTIGNQIAALDLLLDKIQRGEHINTGQLVQHIHGPRLEIAEGDDNQREIAESSGAESEEDETASTGTEDSEFEDTYVDCTICRDEYLESQTIKLPCNTVWCQTCIKNHFKAATAHGSGWPPKCCRDAIPKGTFVRALSKQNRDRFEEKSAEWSIKDRTYCFRASCSAFIHPDTIEGRIARCLSCREVTCAECKGLLSRQRPVNLVGYIR